MAIYKLTNRTNQILHLYPAEGAPVNALLSRASAEMDESFFSGYTRRLEKKGLITLQQIEEEIVEETIEETPPEEVVEETTEESSEESIDPQLAELLEMRRSELDELATELGLDPEGFRNKQEIAEAIMSTRENG